MLQVTESAAEAVKAIVEQAEVGATGGLRIAVDESDESVELGVEESAGADDTVIDEDGARVFLDARRRARARRDGARRERPRRPLPLRALRAGSASRG